MPLGTFVAVTGVSGSGKSTLVTEVLYRALARELNGSREPVGAHDRLDRRRAHRQDHRDRPEPDRPDAALEPGDLHRPVRADPRAVRGRARVARPRLHRRAASRFNVKGGRCENCKGDGILKIEMQFLPDVYVPCEVCKGKRYNREALEIHYKGKSIADVLEMTIAEALDFFSAVPNVKAKLADAVRRRPRLRPSRPAGDDAVGRRGAAGQAVDRAVAAGDRPDALRPRRADDRSPLRRRREAARGPPPARRWRQHGPRHRAQPRRHQDGRLDRRPGAGGRRPRRPDHRRGHAGEGRRDPGSATGEYLERVLRGEPLVPLSDVTFAEEAGRARDPDRTNGHVRRRRPCPRRLRASARPPQPRRAEPGLRRRRPSG